MCMGLKQKPPRAGQLRGFRFFWGYRGSRSADKPSPCHGLGDCCVDFVTPRTEDMQRTYGVAGVHYRVGVPGIDQPEQGNSAT